MHLRSVRPAGEKAVHIELGLEEDLFPPFLLAPLSLELPAGVDVKSASLAGMACPAPARSEEKVHVQVPLGAALSSGVRMTLDQPAPDMTVGGAQWVFMERDDTLAGFSSTPVFLKLFVERGEDLPDVPRFPATTMVLDMDWTEDWTWEFMPPSLAGLQWQALVYKGSFSAEDVLNYYEDELPGYGWQMGGKFYGEDVELGPICGSDVSGIGFWKEAEHGGVPYFTDTVRILAFEMDGISLIAIIYVPVDIPTLPGTELVLWTSAWPLGPTMHMEFQGKVVPAEAIGDFTTAAGALQWELDDLDELTWWAAFADFHKPIVTPGGLEGMQLDVDFWFVGNDGDGWPWTIEQTVIIDVERRAPMPPP